MKRGRTMWSPPELLDELNDIKQHKNIHSNTKALTKLVEYARVGREVEVITNLDFKNSLLFKRGKK